MVMVMVMVIDSALTQACANDVGKHVRTPPGRCADLPHDRNPFGCATAPTVSEGNLS